MTELRFRDAERLAHAYIVTAQDRQESLRAALRVAAAAVCTGRGDLPCGVCRACRKVQAGIHPDVIRIRRLQDDKGRPRKEITVDQVRRMAMDAVVLPNEAERKVYLVEEADLMNLSAQNAALKLLEEPPRGVIFLLCAVNAQLLLPTVRSRCAEINCNGDAAPADEESVQLARGYLRAVAGGDGAELYRWCSKNEGMDGRAAAAFVDCVSDQTAEMLCGRRDALGMDRTRLRAILQLMGRCAAYLKVNVGVKHIFGLLAVDSIAGNGNRG